MKINKSKLKQGFHKNNIHKEKYNLNSLVNVSKDLKQYLTKTPNGEDTVDFGNPNAVIELNKALLKYHYKINFWEIPNGFLCPPVPGRVDYIHYIADLLPKNKKNIKVLDIGTGANCIYPLVGNSIYNWKFIGSDIDPLSVKNAKLIVEKNNLKDSIDIRLQEDKNSFFKGIIGDEFVDITICNPPFHSSLKEAISANERKRKNLNKTRTSKLDDKLNFGGQKAELWCKGGEFLFLKKMAKESVSFSQKVGIFTSLVSKGENVKPLMKILKKLGASNIKTIEMLQGHKTTRIIVWDFK